MTCTNIIVSSFVRIPYSCARAPARYTHYCVITVELVEMAQQHKQQNVSVGFKTVQLFKDQTLGIGSYGKVCKAKCDDLLCAAKLIHETLFDPTAHQLMSQVTDFGMARFGDQNPRATQLPFTMCPGTDVYMPPEAVQDKPVYTEKIDCFSFGVITLQILTRQFPNPGDRSKEIEINQHGIPAGTVAKIPVPEMERRQNHVSIIDPNHTLLQVSLVCLKDRDVERPSAQQLCERVAALKESSEYSESVQDAEERNTAEQGRGDERDREIGSRRQQHTQQVQGLQKIIQSQVSRLEKKDQALREKDETIATGQQMIREQRDEISQLEREKNEIMLEKERLKREKDQTIEEKERQLGRVNQQLEEGEQVIAQFQRRITELEQLRPATDATPRSKQQSSIRARIKMTWREGRKAPHEMSSPHNAVADGTALYVRLRNKVYAFTTSTSSWSQLPDSPTDSCPSVIVNNLLTLVGGEHREATTNKLFSLTGEGRGRRWTEKIPPMPTKRNVSTALCTGTALIVAGGRGEDHFTLQTVEVMNTETLQWSTAAHLPQPVSCVPGAICGDLVYILLLESRSKSMYTCPVSALIQSCRSRPTADVWNKVTAPPVTLTACVSILGRLLTIGGVDSNIKSTTDVYMYNPDSDSWEVISHMATPRYHCFAAVLSNNQLIVVGGYSAILFETDSVELATVE